MQVIREEGSCRLYEEKKAHAGYKRRRLMQVIRREEGQGSDAKFQNGNMQENGLDVSSVW